MWNCAKCGEAIEDSFHACWKCGTSERNDVEAPADNALKSDAKLNPISCPRCDKKLEYVGRKRFHEGTNWGVFGELGELFVKREHFDVYVCPRCGRVEFFVDGIGEEYRPN